MPERIEFSATGQETLLSVSEYFGVKPRAEVFGEDAAESRAESLEGYRRVYAGDLVMNYMLAWKGAYGVSDYDGIVSPAYAVYQVNPLYADQRFIHHYLRSAHMHTVFKARSKGIIESRLRLYPDAFLSMGIDLPDLTTQRRIADFLDRETARIDRLVERKRRLTELVQEWENSYIAHKFSQIDARAWRVRLLGKLKNGAGFPVNLQGDPSNDIAFFKVKHLAIHGLDATITDTDDTVSEDIARSLRATVFPKGTIVFAKIGAAVLLGRFSMLGRAACIDNNMSAFVPNGRLIEPDFALLGLSQANMKSMVQPGAVPSLGTEAFYSFKIPLPSKEFQCGFVDEFRSWRSTIVQIVEKTQRSIVLLREFRSALITAAVTGQIDVATWAEARQTDLRTHSKPEGRE